MNLRRSPEEVAFDVARRHGSDLEKMPYQIGAVFADPAGRIFSWGWNHIEGVEGLVHGESHAIRRADKRRLSGATIYVAGLRSATANLPERVITAKPCKACMSRIMSFGVGRISYSAPDGWKTLRLAYI